jgi:serine/threonine protein kinase/tetratricopeptide (TPR) repeat protein
VEADMSGDRERMRDIFDQARRLPKPEREAFLNGLATVDGAMRVQIEDMLAALDEAGTFLSEPTQGGAGGAAATMAAPLREVPGTRIGPYKLLQLIGEGGFGSVFLAQQEKPVSRKVALKIIKLGMDTRQVIARFEAERQALALMEHPNIARVLDAGATDTGRPYFVMELCKGEAIVEYCDKHNLGIPERLDLFAQVCQAVQHAHTKGIIHRDIKPSNILVSTQDGRPHAKVIDFGIAKATASRLTEKTLFTEHRQLIGTPEYMSPEQAEGSLDIDTRTDVYSLGVLLYELLTGTTPFSGKELRSAAYAEIQRIIREVEPPKPSTRLSHNTDTLASVAAHRHTEPKKLGPLVRGELDWIVMKALEKDRGRRYETANGLAMDVRRYLSGDAVVAAPPSTAYRMRKFVRRHRTQVVGAGVVAAALVLGLAGTAWQASVANRQSRVAHANEQRAIAEARRADAAKEDEAIARKRAETISDFVAAALQAGDAENYGGEGPMRAANHDMTILEAMDGALRDIDSGRFKNDPRTEAELRLTIGIILRNNAKYEEAKPALEHALVMYERLLKSDDPMLAHALTELALLEDADGQPARAEPLFKRALEIRERAFSPDDQQVVVGINLLAGHYLERGEYAQAEPLLVRAMSFCERAFGPDDDRVVDSLANLARFHFLQGHYAQAEPMYKRTLAICERVRGPDHTQVAKALSSLAENFRMQNEYDQAIPLFTRSLAIYERALGPDHPSVGSVLNDLAVAYQPLGRYTEAESLLRRALSIHEKACGPEHPDVATDLNNLGLNYQAQGQFDQAEPLYERSIAIRNKVLGPDHPRTLQSKANLAGLYWSRGKLDKSVPMYEEVSRMQVAKLGRHHPSTLFNLANLGVNYRDSGRIAEGISLLEEVHRASKEFASLRRFSSELLAAYALAPDAASPEDSARIQSLVQELLADARAALPERSPDLAGQLATLSLVLLKAKAWNQAEPLLRESLEIREAKAPDDWRTFNTKSMLGETRLGQTRFAEAEPLLVQGYQGMKDRESTIPPKGRVRIVEAIQRVVHLYEAWDKAEPGKGYDAKAAEWKSKLDAAPPTADKK